MDLFEIIIWELLEIGENETILTLLKESVKPAGLYEEFPERCLSLQYMANQPKLDIKQIYSDGLTKEKRRMLIA